MLFVGLFWLSTHFFLYVVWLRRWAALRTETGIFRFHLYSVLALALVTGAGLFWGGIPQSWAVLAAVVSLHGIYSVSFLELWSLAQGGYSLSILDKAASGANLTAPQERRELEQIGDLKRCDRLSALRSFGLVALDGEKLRLTASGRICNSVLRAVIALANLRSVG